MPRSKPDKQALLAVLAEHVLEQGLNTASLRPMAAAANTSDRMLIYHFGSKDALIEALLEFLAERMAVGLDAAVPLRVFDSEAELLREIVGLMRSEPFKPYVRVWLDIVSAAAQGSALHRGAGYKIIGIYLDWLTKRHPDGASGAAFALTFIEGVLVMDAVMQNSVPDAGLASLQTRR